MAVNKCLNCGETLFDLVQLDEKGNLAMDEENPIDLQMDGVDRSFECSQCGAKNVVTMTSSEGLSQLQISHVKK